MNPRKIIKQDVVTSFPHHRSVLAVSGWLAISLFSLLICEQTLAEAVNDVRILIDVSGSMKTNDPQNLRAPAVRMLVGLMPEGARSGLWTFGRYVNMQVKLSQVDDAWKKQAMAEAKKIHSRGLYTNIEDAIQRATGDWKTPDPGYRRHLILLTDGMVDINKDPRLNEQSRRRILNDILPRIEAADATIHTIALSKNADAQLLSALSGATKGAFEQVDSAAQLQRIFLRLFEKSVNPDSLPIEDNKFSVDKHVSDITVLVFLAKDSPATSLTLPSGQKWSAQSHPESVSWHHEESYDLITVKEPEAGEWALQAKVDTDNRVMVVTNLRLNVDKLPNTLLLGDNFDVRARLMEDGKTLSNASLLSKTQFELKQSDQENNTSSSPLNDNGEAPDVIKGDGIFSARISEAKKAGSFELAVRANSLTFVREIRHNLQVYDSPANISITQEAEDNPFVITISPHAGLIRPESVSMQMSLPDGEPQIIKQIGESQWAIEVPADYANKTFTLTLAGNRYTDEAVKMQFEQRVEVTDIAQSLALKMKPAPASHTEQTPAAGEHSPTEQELQSESQATTTPAEQEPMGFNWMLVLILVVVVNVLVLTGGWFAYRQWRKRQTAQEDAVTAELES